MRRLLNAFPDMLHKGYEQIFFYNAAGARSTKVRKYAHVDITKEFDLLTQRRTARKEQALEELYKKHDEKQQMMQDLVIKDPEQTHVATFSDSEENDRLNKRSLALQREAEAQLTQEMREERMALVKSLEKDDLSEKILISGIHKICVLGMLKYHQIRQELFEEVSLHPEILREFEELHFHVENNFPIEKELVFKLVPELFRSEINKLSARDRLRFKKPRISFVRADGEQLEVDQDLDRQTELEALLDKSLEMEMYLLEQTSDVFAMYSQKMRDEILYGKHVDMKAYMMQLNVMQPENMKDWERRLFSEIKELRAINDDIKALQQHLWEKPDEIVVPDFMLSTEMEDEAVQLLNYAEKYLTLDMRDTKLLPTPANRGPDFDERLREAMDVDALIEESNNELADYANKRIALPAKDLSKKDTDLLQKVSLLAQAVKPEDVPILAYDINEEWVLEETLRRELPTEKRLLVDDVYKMLFFNNQDPELFNLQFWSDHYNIPAAALRNIVNYVAFPVTDQKTKKVIEVLYFIDSDLVKKAQQNLLPESISRDEYLGFLEQDYSHRMVEQYGEEAGIFGRIGPTVTPLSTDAQTFLTEENEPKEAQLTLDSFVSNQVSDIMDDTSVIDQIDQEIQEVQDAKASEQIKQRNLKSSVKQDQ